MHSNDSVLRRGLYGQSIHQGIFGNSVRRRKCLRFFRESTCVQINLGEQYSRFCSAESRLRLGVFINIKTLAGYGPPGKGNYGEKGGE